MSGVGPISQDWEPVVIRKKPLNAAAKKDEKAVNAARRSGAEIETLKKSTAGTNRAASSTTSLNTRKLDDETENLTQYESGKAIPNQQIIGKLERALGAKLRGKK
ncbi:hypothetical protein ACFE04_023639 [Oxalis oulophora]